MIMASVFFKFNYTKEDNKELNEIKTIIVPQLNVVDKIVDGGETTFFVKNLGSGANYDKVVSLGGITSLEMLYPQGTWTGNTWGELLRVTITSYNGKRLNTANVRHINPHDICSIRTEKGETTITTNNRVSAGQYNGFEIYKTASTINDMGTIINALPTQNGGILDAPTDGRTYGRKDSNWQVITDSDLDKYLISGGASWSGTGLVYDVSGLEYYFNGDKLAAATQITLDASDPDYNRLDAIVVDEAGVVSVIKGDASASPISPSVDESHILVQYILVEAGTTEPTIAKEDIYLENAEWTTSTYTTGTATGSIDFDNAVSPKQGVKCISANADARLGARFVRTTSFDPYQYTMLSMWVRFTGSNVATNKSLNVRFENGAGALVANTINLFNFGLQRNLLNVWQLVVIPITSFGALPISVKGLKIIMTGGTVGQARQWDIDLILLTDNSVPAINEQVFNVLKDGALVGQSSSLNFKGGAVNVTKDAIGGKIDIEVVGGGELSAITAATAAHTINNGAFTQEWKWDSLTNGTGLKLSSNSTLASSNSQSIFEIANSGANGTSTQTTYGAIFSNTKTGTSSTNIGLMAIATGATKNIPIYAQTATSEVLRLQSTGISGRWISFFDNSGETGRVGYLAGAGSTYNVQLDIVNKTASGGIGMFVNGKTTPSIFIQNSGGVGINNAGPAYTLDIVPIAPNYYTINVSNGGIYRTVTSSSGAGGFEIVNSNFSATHNTHLETNNSGVFSIFQSPSTVHDLSGINLASTNNVGIGSAPSASAKLELSSTTQGFLPPRMTASQASAIASPAKSLIVYVTDTNGTFTSAGIWIYTTSWKLILAE